MSKTILFDSSPSSNDDTDPKADSDQFTSSNERPSTSSGPEPGPQPGHKVTGVSVFVSIFVFASIHGFEEQFFHRILVNDATVQLVGAACDAEWVAHGTDRHGHCMSVYHRPHFIDITVNQKDQPYDCDGKKIRPRPFREWTRGGYGLKEIHYRCTIVK